MFGFFRPRVDLSHARRLVENGGLLLDVRTTAEFAAGHVDSALNIPVQELAQRLHELGSKDRPIVVYCRSGARSASAARLLQAQGFQSVLDIGPMPPW